MALERKPIVGIKQWDALIDKVETNETAATTNASDITTLEGNNPVVTIQTSVDASAGGTAETTAIATIPADSLLLNVTAVTTAAFDGDATTTAEVGIAGNIDAYIDTVDLDVSTLDTQASSLGGTTNDVKVAQYLDAETGIIATWTNTASSTAGTINVIVTYIPLA